MIEKVCSKLNEWRLIRRPCWWQQHAHGTGWEEQDSAATVPSMAHTLRGLHPLDAHSVVHPSSL